MESPFCPARSSPPGTADPAAVAKVESFAREHGLKVEEVSLPRRTVTLSGTAAQMSKAFDTQFERCQYRGRSYRARTGPIMLSTDLAPSIEAVLGLDDRAQAKAHFRVLGQNSARASAQPAVSYSPPQVAQLYSFPSGADGTGQTVGIIELGGGYKPADLQNYFASLGLKKQPTVISVSVDQATNSPTAPDSADGEVLLDIEIVGAVAPGARIVVYFAPNTSRGYQDALTTAIHDATNKPSVITSSWGNAESTWTAQSMTAFETAAQDAAALGVTICAASGDDGSSDAETDGANHVDFPPPRPTFSAAGARLWRAPTALSPVKPRGTTAPRAVQAAADSARSSPCPPGRPPPESMPHPALAAACRTWPGMPIPTPATTFWSMAKSL